MTYITHLHHILIDAHRFEGFANAVVSARWHTTPDHFICAVTHKRGIVFHIPGVIKLMLEPLDAKLFIQKHTSKDEAKSEIAGKIVVQVPSNLGSWPLTPTVLSVVLSMLFVFEEVEMSMPAVSAAAPRLLARARFHHWQP